VTNLTAVKTPVGAGIVLIENDVGLILAVTRKGTLTDWSLPGGKLELGESFANAAIRETEEEVELEVSRLQLVYEGPSCTESNRWVKTFRAGLWLGSPRAVEPNTRIAWLRKEEFMGPSCSLSPYYRKLFAHLES
jgi:8-oxo-dGTP pyrophosphatase MutT (NUDIX family)